MNRPSRRDDEYQRSPEVRAKMSAARKRAWADPAVRAKRSAASKRAWAKAAVRLASLPLLRTYVDRAVLLFAAGNTRDSVADALQQEFRDVV